MRAGDDEVQWNYTQYMLCHLLLYNTRIKPSALCDLKFPIKLYQGVFKGTEGTAQSQNPYDIRRQQTDNQPLNQLMDQK